MPIEAILAVLKVLTPVAADLLSRLNDKHKAAGTPVPTDVATLEAELAAELAANSARILGSVSAWRAAHPNA